MNDEYSQVMSKRCKVYESKLQEFVIDIRARIDEIERALQSIERYRELEPMNMLQQKVILGGLQSIHWKLNQGILKEVEAQSFIDEWKFIYGLFKDLENEPR